MKPETFIGQQKILGAPSNWDSDKMGRCEGLPVSFCHDCIYSQWGFNWADRLKILFGKKLLLIVHANSMSPVSMEIAEFEPPKEQREKLDKPFRRDGIPRPIDPPSHRPYG